MGVTAKEVARRAGVSAAAVSMVFHNKPGISEPVRAHVLAVAEELGYEPAGSGPAARARILQFVIYKRHGKVVGDTPFFEQLTKGVADEVRRLGYQLSISYFYSTENVREQLRSITSIKCAGIVLLATEMHTQDMNAFAALDVPIVLLDNFFPARQYDAVVIDNRYGAWNAVRYLVQCGHKRLGYLHSSVEIRNFRERSDGYLSGVRSSPEADADSVQRIVRVGTTPEAAAADMAAWLAGDPALPTAFFADNDLIAAGCCRALLNAGYRIPEDVSVIGFDDSAICQLMAPKLSTMRVQKERMGALAVQRLDLRIREHPAEIVRLSVLPEIVRRESVLEHAARGAEPPAGAGTHP